MPKDFTFHLWLLKLGAPINLAFLAQSTILPHSAVDANILVPAQILWAVSAFRCLFPNRYNDNVVFHRTPLSSIFLTRLLATFVEVAYIYQFSVVLRALNVNEVAWVDALSWIMVLQVVVSQGFVWGAILLARHEYYAYEEFGWFVIFVANTIASVWLYLTVDVEGPRSVLLPLNLLFGLGYLPWQTLHVRQLAADARKRRASAVPGTPFSEGLRRALFEQNRRTDAESWGGIVGLTWMTAYWATLIPLWLAIIVHAFSA